MSAVRSVLTRNRMSPAQRFWAKVAVSDGCWLWTAARTRIGYGSFWDGRRRVPAHRFSWELHGDAIPLGFLVLHRCNVRHCVRPDHLYVGTEVENAWDRDVAGHNGRAKLTAEDVRTIRQRCRDQADSKALAREFGVSAAIIEGVARRLSWHHVPEDAAL